MGRRLYAKAENIYNGGCIEKDVRNVESICNSIDRMPTNNKIKYREFTIEDEQNTSYLVFYNNGTCCAYDVDGRDVKVPKHYYDEALQLVREKWGNDYTPIIINQQMTEDEIKEMQETSKTFVASLTPEVFRNSRISLVD